MAQAPPKKKSQVLIIDDSDLNIDVLLDTLGAEYDLRVAISGEMALQLIANEIAPDLILLDILMPGISGYDVCQALKADEKTRPIPIIFLTSLTEVSDQKKGFSLGATDYIFKPFTPQIVRARVETQLKLKEYSDHLSGMVTQKTEQLSRAQEAIITSMAIMAEFRDPETGAHIQRTKAYVQVLAQEISKSNPAYLSGVDIELLANATPLHDIGKVAISDEILFKPDALTPHEFAIMQQHTVHGADIIRRAEGVTGANLLLHTARELAEYHHEKWDGSGYPHGLSGEDIPVAARIMTLADIYDALISKRPYKPAFSHEKTLDMILNGNTRIKPQHFDPMLLDCFRRIHDQFNQIAVAFPD